MMHNYPLKQIQREDVMKMIKVFFWVSMAFLLFSSAVVAGDFDWIDDLNIQAEADQSGFRARLATRFNIGDAQIKVVLGNVERPADAYMVFRLGEMSNQPTDRVIEKYKSGHGNGWGTLAKSLGIKPGSKEFHSLKQGHDLYDEKPHGKSKGKGKGKK
jgi:hypothetical protein